MKKIIHILFYSLFIHANLSAQDTVLQRIILIGDAGEMDTQQKMLIADAAGKIIPGKTTVVFLGDNIYPTGMSLPGTKDEALTKQILQSQFMPMRSKGAAVYFVPGNHDWDRSGPHGLQKIKLEGKYLREQNDPQLKLVPENGCPDPYEINVSDSLVIIAMDSEWWLYPFDKSNPSAECDCKTKDDVIAKLEELSYKNRYKVVVLAMHHPFESYGRHGGYFSLKDHLFPLTAVNKNLYLPLPLVGSLYPILRRTFSNPEDLHHPLYKKMQEQVDEALKASPNFIHAAGHEHTLQFIKDAQTQIVSGSGSKESYVRKGADALYASVDNGYVIADLVAGNDLFIHYYTLKDSVFENSFSYKQEYKNVKQEEEISYQSIKGDSVTIQAHPQFAENGGLHHFLFGENYRKEYAAQTTVPVIRISEIKGGLIPYKRGGGHQSHSLRLKDKDGKEWVLRSVDKYPEVLLPENLRETFAADWIKDAMSAQHPYAALVVPVIADAVHVPHSNPIIGYVSPDKNLGIYSKTFNNTLCLLEEREPVGKSDNTADMFEALNKDNDNNVDSAEFLRARLLDLFLGDWDRHEDQWRWADIEKGKDKKYIAVPRDRDQVFHVTEGLFPSFASRPWVAPFLHNFDGHIKKVNAFFFESRNMNGRLLNQFTHDEWMQQTNAFVSLLTDTLLESALKRLPAAQYNIRHDELLNKWKARRENMAAAMEKYYYFFNKTIDIQTSDKNEFVSIKDLPGDSLQVSIHKISKDGKIKDLFYDRIFSSDETKEIRLFVRNGNDSVVINNHQSKIKLRIVSGDGSKAYNILSANNKIRLYAKPDDLLLHGDASKLHKHISADSMNTVVIPTNLYHVTAPLFAAGYNLDDGILLGAGFHHTHSGFRKIPYGSKQSFTMAHSFSTNAYRIKYNGEWLKAFGKADFILQASALAPENTQNFFGLGNETIYDKNESSISFYRTRFTLYEATPALQWRYPKGISLSAGSTIQYYSLDKNDNAARFILQPGTVKSYDSLTIANNKLHAGLLFNFNIDKRNNKLFPSWGSYVNIKFAANAGLNQYSKSFMHVMPEVALYKSISSNSSFIIANRLGACITAGKTAFYQSAFLGGHDNLLGYRQYRFAGRHSLYNNLEARLRFANVANYILPGQIGISSFFDVGRVWADGDHSDRWHNGFGGGIYFAPAGIAVIEAVAGYSKEGWYPYVRLGFRF